MRAQNSTSIPAIVLDGNQRSALAAVRALGKRGHRVIVAETERRCLAASSRYCHASLVYPDPGTHAADFVAWLKNLNEDYGSAVLLPMTDVTVPLVLGCRASLENLCTALPSLEAYATVTDKRRLYELAARAGVRTPRTRTVSRTDFDSLRCSGLAFPVVVKPRHSATQAAGKIVRRTVSYARSRDELEAEVESMLIDDDDELLLQEYIEGTGEGLFASYCRGTPALLFAHRRLREKPPTGGVSVLCESVPLRSDLVEVARRILEPLAWHGAAMLEFKIDAEGRAWLIEINARLWGSLQLAVDSNADFPALLYDTALGSADAPDAPEANYTVGRRLRWLLGDLDSLYIMLKQRGPTAASVWDKAAAVGRFCLPWMPGLRYELLRCSDPRPAAFAAREYLRQTARSPNR